MEVAYVVIHVPGSKMANIMSPESKKDDKDQETIQLSTIPDP